MRPIRNRSLAFLGGALLVVLVFSVQPAAAASGSTDGNITAYRAEGMTLPSGAAVERAIANKSVPPADELVLGDTLVVTIESERLATDMAAANGSTTDRFFSVVGRNVTFRLLQTNPTPQQTKLVGRMGPRNATVFRNGTVTYVLVDTGSVRFHHRGQSEPEELYGDERFVAQFGYAGNDSDASALSNSREFGLHPYKSRLYSNGYTYKPLPPERVQAAVDVQILPEESLILRVRLAGNRNRTVRVSPADESSFKHVWLDLRHVQTGTPYTLELVHDGEVTDRYAGNVTAPRAELREINLTALTTDHLVTRDGERVTETITDHAAVTATVMLSHGGKVQVFDADCDQVGYAWIDAGKTTRVTMKLWQDGTPIRDVNRSEYAFLVRAVRNPGASRARYTNGTTVVRQKVDGRCPAATESTPPPMTATSAAPTTHEPTEVSTITVTTDPPSPVPDESSETTSPGQPGFTLVALLCAAGVLVGRRFRSGKR